MNPLNSTRALRLERLESRCLLAAFAFSQEGLFDHSDIRRSERSATDVRADVADDRSQSRRGSSDRLNEGRSDRLNDHRDRQGKNRGDDHDRQRSNIREALVESRRERFRRSEKTTLSEPITQATSVDIPNQSGLTGQTNRTVIVEIERPLANTQASGGESNNRLRQPAGEPASSSTPFQSLVSQTNSTNTPSVENTENSETSSRTPVSRQTGAATIESSADPQANNQADEARLTSDEPTSLEAFAPDASVDSQNTTLDSFAADASSENDPGRVNSFGLPDFLSQALIDLSPANRHRLSDPIHDDAAEANEDDAWEIHPRSIESLRDVAGQQVQPRPADAETNADEAIASWFGEQSGLIQIYPIGHLQTSRACADSMVNVVLDATIGLHRQLDMIGVASAETESLSMEARDAILATLFAKQSHNAMDTASEPTPTRASTWTYPGAVLVATAATIARRHARGRGKMLSTRGS